MIHCHILQPSSEPLELPAPPPLSSQQLQLLHQLQQNEVRELTVGNSFIVLYSLASFWCPKCLWFELLMASWLFYTGKPESHSETAAAGSAPPDDEVPAVPDKDPPTAGRRTRSEVSRHAQWHAPAHTHHIIRTFTSCQHSR